jgi:hypothetical protein
MKAYPKMTHGWCLPRIIHFILALQFAWPDKAILIAKHDCSDACRQIAHSATAMAQTITALGALAFVCWRLAFRGSPKPPTWHCFFSEFITDLANWISMCAKWESDTLQSPDQPVTPEPVRLGPEVPFAKARPIAFTTPPVIT